MVDDGGETYRPNEYYERRFEDDEIAAEAHRRFVGGSWQAIGGLQLRFLREQGLRRSDRLLDVGCGALRAGVRFVRYLDAGNYFGLDVNADLLRAGLDIELPAAGLADKLPSTNLRCEDRFDASRFGVTFDMAIAQSVFTHLPLNHIRLCLVRLASVMAPGGAFFATFFRCPAGHPIDEPLQHAKATTHTEKDPFHYRVDDFAWAISELPWRIDDIGDWGHPFGQEMLRFDFVG